MNIKNVARKRIKNDNIIINIIIIIFIPLTITHTIFKEQKEAKIIRRDRYI